MDLDTAYDGQKVGRRQVKAELTRHGFRLADLRNDPDGPTPDADGRYDSGEVLRWLGY